MKKYILTKVFTGCGKKPNGTVDPSKLNYKNKTLILKMYHIFKAIRNNAGYIDCDDIGGDAAKTTWGGLFCCCSHITLNSATDFNDIEDLSSTLGHEFIHITEGPYWNTTPIEDEDLFSKAEIQIEAHDITRVGGRIMNHYL